MTFQIGTVESCVQIVIVDDSLALEGEETIVVSFTAPPGIQQGSPPSSTISIIDNDGETLSTAHRKELATSVSRTTPVLSNNESVVVHLQQSSISKKCREKCNCLRYTSLSVMRQMFVAVSCSSVQRSS